MAESLKSFFVVPFKTPFFNKLCRREYDTAVLCFLPFAETDRNRKLLNENDEERLRTVGMSSEAYRLEDDKLLCSCLDEWILRCLGIQRIDVSTLEVSESYCRRLRTNVRVLSVADDAVSMAGMGIFCFDLNVNLA